MRARPALALALLLTACGGPEPSPPDAGSPDAARAADDADGDAWRDDEDVCPEVADPEQRDRDRDGLGDACDPCRATPSGGPPGPDGCDSRPETEPNDAPGAGEPLSLAPGGRVVEVLGTIEGPGPAGQAFDRFRLMVPARTRLRIRVARASPASRLEPFLELTGGSLGAPRVAEGRFVATREVYLAGAGVHELAVTDRRGVRGEPPRGGPEAAYALGIEVLEARAEPLSLPALARPVRIDPEGPVPLFDLDLPAARTRFLAETDLGRGLAAEGVDAILVVELEDGARVLENDGATPGALDPLLVETIRSGTRARVAVDHRRALGEGPHEVRLTVDQPRADGELEPNDQPALASALVFPGFTSGRIDRPVDPANGPPDVDHLSLTGAAGQVVAISTVIPPSSQVDPTVRLLRVHGPGDVEVLHRNDDATGRAARVEAILPDDGTYVLELQDARNLAGQRPARGGELFAYQVLAEGTGLNADPRIVAGEGTLEGVLDPGGRLGRHLVVAEGPSLLELDTGATGAPDLELVLRIHGPAARGLLGEGTGDALAFLPAAETYVVGVQAADGQGSPERTYAVAVRVTPLAPVAAMESPAALPLEAPAAVIGDLASSDDVDRFVLDAAAGQRLDAALRGGPRAREVTVLGPGEAPVARGPRGVRAARVTTGGPHVIEVRGAAGPYTLVVRLR